MTSRTAGCNCGAVRLKIDGEPIRIGLCHCGTCRKETGGPFLAFAVFPESAVAVAGKTSSWTDETLHRHFCPTCGSPLFTLEGNGEIEIRLGSLDEAPSGLVPSYESWTIRREAWIAPVPGARQLTRNRDDAD